MPAIDGRVPLLSLKSPRTWALIAFAVALLLLAAVAYAIAGSRNGLMDYRSAFGLLGQLGQAGAVALLFAVGVLIATLRSKAGGTAYAATAAVLLAVMVGCMVAYQAAPPPGPLINDITTDLDDPPRFSAVLPLRPEGSNAAEYGGPEVAAAQRQVHPEIQPLHSTLAPRRAFERALEVADELGWDIVAQSPDTGIIEAVDTTPFFRFKDDVVIRVRPDGQGSRIDLRSHSRVGRSDLGKNAARIMEFVRAFPMRG